MVFSWSTLFKNTFELASNWAPLGTSMLYYGGFSVLSRKFSTWGDIMDSVGDTISTGEDIQYCGAFGFPLQYWISSTVLWYAPQYWIASRALIGNIPRHYWIPFNVLMVSPLVLIISPPKYWTPSPLLHRFFPRYTLKFWPGIVEFLFNSKISFGIPFTKKTSNISNDLISIPHLFVIIILILLPTLRLWRHGNFT